MNPLDFAGPKFLGLYFSLLPLAIFAGWILRTMVRRSISGGWAKTKTLDPYELAYLAHGPTRAVQTGMVALVEKGAVKAAGGGSFRASGGLPATENRFLHGLHQLCISSEPYFTQLLRKSADSLEAIDANLTSGGLLLPTATRQLGKVLSVLPLLCLMLLGIAKIFVGMSRNRPVGFLVIACLITAAISAVFWVKGARRTVAGDAMVDRNRQASDEWRYGDSSELPMLVAMLGTGVLGGTEFASLRDQLAPPRGVGDGGWGGSSCGGSSCGGGGGCGGGGCGGCGGG